LRILQLLWEIPPTKDLWPAPPTALLSHLLGHEGPGSIFAALQDRGWVTALSAGERIGQEDVAAFQVRAALTEEGEAHWQEIGHLVYGYLRVLAAASDGELQRHWEEIRTMCKVSFDYTEPTEPYSTSASLSKRLLLYGHENVLSARRIIGPLDVAAFRRYLACLQPSHCVAVRCSPSFEEGKTLDKQERWYGVPYADGPLDQGVADLWEAQVLNDGWKLHLPAPNPYIATEFPLVATQAMIDASRRKRMIMTGASGDEEDEACGCGEQDGQAPGSDEPAGELAWMQMATPGAFADPHFQRLVGSVLYFDPPKTIRQDDRWELFHKLDSTFQRPKASMNILLVSPLAANEPILAALLARVVNHKLQQQLYSAEVAGLGWGFSSHTLGFLLSVSGYSPKLPLLLTDIFQELASMDLRQESDRFDIVREQLVRNLRNFAFERADTHASLHLRLFMEPARWTTEDKLKAALDATPDDVADLHRRMLSSLTFRALVHGNLDESEALAMSHRVDEVISRLPFAQTMPPPPPPLAESTEPPVGHFVLEEPVPSPSDKNSATLLCFSVGHIEHDRHQSAALSLLIQIIREPLFTTLRTREQLGYIVSCYEMAFGAGEGSPLSGFAVNILSKTHAPAHLEHRALEFLSRFRREVLPGITQEAFDASKGALISKLLDPPKRLSQEFSRWWPEIAYHDYDWKRNTDTAAAVQALTLDDIEQLYDAILLQPESRRLFSSRVIAHAHQGQEAQECAAAQAPDQDPPLGDATPASALSAGGEELIKPTHVGLSGLSAWRVSANSSVA